MKYSTFYCLKQLLFIFRGAVLIMGGLILNVLVGASLYDPVQEHLKRVRKKSHKQNGVYYIENKTNDKANGEIIKSPEEKALLDTVIFETQEIPLEKDEILLEYHSSSPHKSFSGVNQPLLLTEGNLNIVSKNGGSRVSLGRQISNSESVQQISRKISTGSYRGRVMGSASQITRQTSISRPIHRVASASTMTRKISVGSNLSSSSFRYISTPFHGSTLVGLNPEFSSQITMKVPQETKTSCLSNLCGCFMKDSSKEAEVKKSESQSGVYRTLLKDPVFLIILVSNATTAIGYTNFTILLPSYAISLGFDKDKASYLLSVVSMFDLMGRVGGSALSDWLPISKKLYYIFGLLFSGISLVLLPLVNSYKHIAMICGTFGLASGTYVGITAIVMVDLLGEDRLASSYGVSLFINGLLQLIGPPICGLVYQQMNSYYYIIVALGSILIFGASVWAYLPFTNRTNKDNVIA